MRAVRSRQPSQGTHNSLFSPSPSIAPGTRPGPAGATLISTGVAGLDAVLGGGAPLGRLLLVAVGGGVGVGGGGGASTSAGVDTGAGGTAVADLLARNFLAEGIARGQPGLWVQAGVREAEWSGGGASTSSPWWLPAPTAERVSRGRSEPVPAADDAASGLRIAWQYRQYIQSNNTSGGGDGGGSSSSVKKGSTTKLSPARGTEAGWCGAHDLATRLPPPDPTLLTCLLASPASAGEVAAFVRAAPPGPAPPRRVVVSGLGSAAWRESASCGGDAAADDPDAPPAWDGVVRLLRTLRSALRCGSGGDGGDAPASILITLPAALFPPPALARALAAADGVLALDALRSDAGLALLLPDPGAVIGLARAVRLPGVGLGGLPRGGGGGGGGGSHSSSSSAAAATTLHAFRLKRGRLTLVPADIDPDAEEALLGGGGGGGGGACAPGPAGGKAAAALAF